MPNAPDPIEFIGAVAGIQMVDGVWTLRLQAPPQEGPKIAALGMYDGQTFKFSALPQEVQSKKL